MTMAAIPGDAGAPGPAAALADIRGSKVDVVVVYKIDRLTRSLLDFAKIVEVFDAHGVSFVSVTQAFNTATSMGRLTLNVLLSFAQFEREVTGERIRDKIAASKKKGMWMGGYPPLGYDVKDRKLVLNSAEAETVRCIFRRYQELGSVRLLKEHLDETGIVSKHRSAPDGRPYGANRLLGEPSTICCRTASIVARSFISIMPIQASTNRSLMRNFGRRFRRPWRQTESIVAPARSTAT